MYMYVLYVYVCKCTYMHVYVCRCMNTNGQRGELTDDWVSSHVLAYDSRIAAQKYGKGRNVSACIALADFVHLPAVDGPILPLVSSRVNLLKLRILLALETDVAQQLLDCIV